MRRAVPSPPQQRRTQLYRPHLGRAASMIFSIFLESPLPEEFQVCERMSGAVQFLAGIRESFPRARPDPADVCRDCPAACGPSNSAAVLETGGAVASAFLPEARRL